MNSIQEEFKKRKRKQILASIIAVIAMLILVIKETSIPIIAMVAIGVVILGCIIFSFMNWRCPSCNKYLGKSMSPKFCKHCGEKLV